MNVNFMRLLAERREHVGRVEVVPEECSVLEFFDSMDGFFMSSDLICPFVEIVVVSCSGMVQSCGYENVR